MKFKEISILVKTHRKFLNSKQREMGLEEFSQDYIGVKLGHKNAQFISNIERGLCSIPNKSIKPLSVLLNIPYELIVRAKLHDFESTMRAEAANA